MPTAPQVFRLGLAASAGSFVVLLVAATMLGGERVLSAWPGYALGAVTMLGALAALAAAFRQPRAPPIAPAEVPEASPAEAFLRLAARAEAWILRARRYLLVGGAAATAAWLPLMGFGLFAAARGPDVPLMRLLALAGLAAFAALGVRWWRRVREVDEELREWRARIQRLRAIEARLLEDPAGA